MRPVLAAALLLAPVAAMAQSAEVPPAIWQDPPHDAAHPARMEVLHIPSGGVRINAVAYLAAGAGPHPTVVLCHGLPGNEKNLDLAQALRRAGWNVISFNYRGSWGSPGTFRFAHNPADLRAVIAFLRAPAQVRALGIDPDKLAVVGHSMGGWVTAMAGSQPGVVALVMISGANMGRMGRGSPTDRLKLAQKNHETLAGAPPSVLARELGDHADAFDFLHAAPAIARRHLLVLTSDDGLAPHGEALAEAVKKAGGDVVLAHAATDHGWSDHRIDLETRVIRYLEPLLR